MKTVLLMRHAKSSWSEPGLADHGRPLNKRGQRDAPRMGQLLRDEDAVPDGILCSTAKRARQTAKAVMEASGFDGTVRYEDSLYGEGPAACLRLLRDLPAEWARAMVVGHNPDMEGFVAYLSGEDEVMPTAAIARIDVPVDDWQALGDDTPGRLVFLWRPKDLR